jgi:hypothetical protein
VALYAEAKRLHDDQYATDACETACNRDATSPCCKYVKPKGADEVSRSSSTTDAERTASLSPVQTVDASPPTPSMTSADAWAQAKREEADSETAALDQVEADLALVDRKATWGDAETDRVARCAHVVGDLRQARDGQLDARLSRVVDRLTPMVKRAIAINDARKKTEAVEQAQRDTETRKQLLPTCIQCCLTSFIGATRDHCQATCGANPSTYVGVNSAELVTQYGGTILYCRTP